MVIVNNWAWGFPGSPVVGTPHPKTEGMDLIPGLETRIPDATGHSPPQNWPSYSYELRNSAHRSKEHLSK